MTMRQNVISSFIVFLVALPLCLGIAVASGVSPEKGIISGVIGGIVVGLFGGAPLQVSGPANSLIVIVAEAVNDIGLTGLSFAVILAGIAQIVAGLVGAGRLAKLFPVAVTKGLMAGFAILIFASQAHVMLDGKPHAKFLENMSSLIPAIKEQFSLFSVGSVPWGAIFGVGAFFFLLAFQEFQSKTNSFIKKIPPALLVVLIATLFATIYGLPLKRVHVPDNLVDDFTFPQFSWGLVSFDAVILEIALTIFFLASTESLLSANAVDQMKEGHYTNYNKELVAQGAANFLCGLVGAIPIAGVVIRSTANIAAGATSRLSTVLHGVWLLAMVGLFPFILDDVPMSILGAILVFSVIRLINFGQINEMAKTDSWAWPMYGLTAIAVLVLNPMAGVGVGIGLQFVKSIVPVLGLGTSLGTKVESPMIVEAERSRD